MTRERVEYLYQKQWTVLHIQIKHEFVVVFITYYTFDVDLKDIL